MAADRLSFADNPFYARDDIAERYNRSRALPEDVEQEWSDLLALHVGVTAALSVDAGCGTGRFTRILASTFRRRVIGIDPSLPMLRSAAASLGLAPGVSLVRGRAEALPLAPRCADLVLMSMSYHHVVDKPAALASVRDTLRDGGVFCVRTCSVEALDSYVYQRFFPAARCLDERRFPTRDGLVAEVSAARFALRKFETVRQRVADDLATYYDRVKLRAHSDLQAVPDQEFESGLRDFGAWVTDQPERPVYEEVDLFTFTAV